MRWTGVGDLPPCGTWRPLSMAFLYRKPGTDLAQQRRAMRLNRFALVCAAAVFLCWPRYVAAFDQLCDSAFEDCRTPLLNLIRAETVAIDVGMWFMEDA